jgi:hypothetical protein
MEWSITAKRVAFFGHEDGFGKRGNNHLQEQKCRGRVQSVSDRANGAWGVPRLRAIFWHFLISIYRPRAMWQVPRSEATNCRATPEGIASIVI